MAASRSYSGPATSPTDGTGFTFSSGFGTLAAGRYVIGVTGRSASAIDLTGLVVGGSANIAVSGLVKKATNADGFGTSFAGLYEVVLTSAINNNIVLTWSASAARAGIQVYTLGSGTGPVFATGQDAATSGSGVSLAGTLDTPAAGVMIALAFMANVSANNRQASASGTTSAVTALAIGAGNGGAGGITFSGTGLTRDTGSDTLLEAGVNGDGVLVMASWSAVQALTATLVIDADSFGAAVVGRGAVALTPTKVSDADSFGTAVVGRGPRNLAPTKVTDADTFGAPNVSRKLSPTKVADTDTFGTAAVGRGPRNLAPTRVVNTSTFGVAIVLGSALHLSPTRVTDADSFGAPAVGRGARNLLPIKYSDLDNFGTHIVSRGFKTLAPTKVADADSFGTPVVTRGARNLAPTKVTDADAFGVAVVGRGARNLALTKVTDADSFGVPAVASGGAPRTLTPTKVTDADSFGTPTVGRGARNLSPTKVNDTDSFGAAIVGGSADRVLLGSGLSASDATSYTFPIPLVTGKNVVAVTARSANLALDIVSITAAGPPGTGFTMTPVEKRINTDGFGATVAAIYEVVLTSVPSNNVFVDFGTVAAARCGVDVYSLPNTGEVYATNFSILDGSGATQTTTIDTPPNGVSVAVAFIANVGGFNRMAAASAQTTLQTGVVVTAANGSTEINWAGGLTEDPGSDLSLEAGSNGDGVLVVASWSQAAPLAPGALAASIYVNPDTFGHPTVATAGGSLPSVMPNFRVAEMIDRFGINTQMNRQDLAYSYYGAASYQRVVNNANYLGSLHVRSIAPHPYNPAAGDVQDFYTLDGGAWNYLASHGLKLCLHHGPAVNYAELKGLLDYTKLLEATYSGSVSIVEGANELSNFNPGGVWPAYTNHLGQTFPAGKRDVSVPPGNAAARQDDLFYAVHTDPLYTVLDSKIVARFTTGEGWWARGACDWHNGHNYPGLQTPQTWAVSGVPDSSPLPARIRNGILDHISESPSETQIITECGMHTYTGGIDIDTHALDILYYWFIATELGIRRCYFYEMYDHGGAGASTTEGHFGFWYTPPNIGGTTNTDALPKPAAIAVHNLNALWNDLGLTKLTFTKTAVQFQLGTLPATAKKLVFQSSTGEHWVLLWNEAPFYNLAAPRGPVTPASTPVTIQVAAGRTVTWYSPVDSMSPVASPVLVSKPLLAKIVSSGVSSQSLFPVKFANVTSFKVPVVSRGAVVLLPTRFSNVPSFKVVVVSKVAHLSPTRATNTSTFGTPAVTKVAHLVPVKFNNIQSFKVPVISRGTVNLTATKLTNASVFGLVIETNRATALPTKYADPDSFGAPVVGRGAVALHPTRHIDPDAFHPLSSVGRGSVGIAPTKASNTSTFGTAVVGRGGVSISATRFTDADSFGHPGLTPLGLRPTLYVNPDTFGTAVVARLLIPPKSLTATRLADADTFGTPVIGRGGVSVSALRYSDADVFRNPAIQVGAVALHPTRYADMDAFGSATAGRGTIHLSPSLLVSQNIFGGAVLGAGRVTLVTTRYSDADSFGAPIAIKGPAHIAPLRYASPDSFGAARVGFLLSAHLFNDADEVVLTPSVAMVLSPDHYADPDEFGSGSISTSSLTFYATRFLNLSTFGHSIVAALSVGYRKPTGTGGGGSSRLPRTTGRPPQVQRPGPSRPPSVQ